MNNIYVQNKFEYNFVKTMYKQINIGDKRGLKTNSKYE